MEEAVRSRVEHEASFNRIEAIKEIMQRIDFSWEQGFLKSEEYVEKRQQLNREMEALIPIDYDELIEAHDLLTHFSTYWDACAHQDDPFEARKQFIATIVDRVFIYGGNIVGVVLHGNFAEVLDENPKARAEVTDALHATLEERGVKSVVGSLVRGQRAWVPHQLHPPYAAKRLSPWTAADVAPHAVEVFRQFQRLEYRRKVATRTAYYRHLESGMHVGNIDPT